MFALEGDAGLLAVLDLDTRGLKKRFHLLQLDTMAAGKGDDLCTGEDTVPCYLLKPLDTLVCLCSISGPSFHDTCTLHFPREVWLLYLRQK